MEYLKACRGEPTAHTPVWLNRQAGRYMPEYMALKGDTPSLDFFKNSEMAAQATVDAQRILGVDAAIIFADLLPILEPMGLELDYVGGVGPVFANPVRSEADVARLAVVPAEEGAGYIEGTITGVLAGVPKDVAVIGFAGAPFTLASYAVEGQSSKNYILIKRMMYAEPAAFDQLMSKLTDTVIDYVKLQIASGVHAMQIFDSWVGCLSEQDYQHYVAPHMRRLFQAVCGTVPVCYFATGNAHLVDAMYATGADFMALDWRTPLRSTWDRLGCRAIQGNMEPIALCADRTTVEAHARRVLKEVDGRAGHIFNLGHGIVPQTPVDNVKFLVDFVHEQTSR